MDAPKMQVKCGVDSCHYWKNSHCNANDLEVNAMHGKNANTSDDTCCTTFKPHDAR
ncbi:MAG: DUF1540 domain-containing protein [Clostridium sp.]|uniref:DUF1540 domain-containing protein n=1 Tax=Clostridium sp. TaxID=1506 RepID=UPI0025C249C0|nr:DUF1540 domain-containing protein [Clostridium sp.]MCH3963791.1 DUF1540 domain-containing protein [Clostridium sp.]MCI1714932.1 DUF1540 domain-containing protein [Clostridium sp.]MCI1798879.1 DUF1540 domain-containing protein [Clostridium sp.]MCI1813115.1 DUF1540 domain-containing protein [Clostridium sp.]MCI1870005.1 DUF1540 domain-containing protein [Clostridium sp.]